MYIKVHNTYVIYGSICYLGFFLKKLPLNPSLKKKLEKEQKAKKKKLDITGVYKIKTS